MQAHRHYRDTPLADWAQARLAGVTADPQASTSLSALFDDYRVWAQANGREAMVEEEFRLTNAELSDLPIWQLLVERDGHRAYDACLGVILAAPIRAAA